MDQGSCSRYNFHEFEYENQSDGTCLKLISLTNFSQMDIKTVKKIELSPLKSHYAVYNYA